MIKNTIKKLSDTIRRKFVEILDASFIQIESDQGWTPVKTMNKTVKYLLYRLHFASGNILECADTHIIIDENYNEVFAKDSLGCKILTRDGTDTVTEVEITDRYEHMYDFELADNSNHLYYTNGVLSHNTTLMTIYALWLANFFPDQNIIICGDKASTATMIFEKIRLAYLELPNWLKCSAVEFNTRSMKLANGSKIVTSATTDSAIRGNTVSCLILDEFAFVEPGIADKFWASVTPTLVTNPNAKLFISSTPNGVGNMFWLLYDNAINGRSRYKVNTVTWRDVPGRDEKWKEETIKTEMNGDTEKFEQEYECKFLGASTSPFGDLVFKRIEEQLSPPMFTKFNDCLKVWKAPANDRVYSIGVDVADGVGQDYSVIQVMDMTDLSHIELVACYASNAIGVTDFSLVVVDVAQMYGCPNLSIERNGPGVEVCSRVYYDKNYPNMVNFGNSNGTKFRPGVLSHTNVRTPAITNWKHWLTERCSVVIHDQDYLDLFRHFGKKDGKWQAENKWHDDLIMASVWALNVLSREVVNKVFDVQEVAADGDPKKVANRFDYRINASEYYGAELQYNVPLVLFTSASHSDVFDSSNARFEFGERRPGDIFDPEAWERLPDWNDTSMF